MNNNFLAQVSQFIKLAIDNTEAMQEKLYMQQKQAAIHDLDKEKYRVALQKTADALYDADFLTDETEKRMFLKKAAEDPIYIMRTLEKVCDAKDVAQIGKPARISVKTKNADDTFDPVYFAAFGSQAHGLLDD